MKEEIKKLLEVVDVLRGKAFEDRQMEEERNLKIMKLERGIESLQDRIKVKDEIVDDLKDVIQLLKGKGKQEEIKK